VKPTLTKRITAALVFAAVNIYACTQAGDDDVEPVNGEGVVLPDGSTFSRDSLIEAFGTCIVGEIENFEEQSRVFSAAVTAAVNDPEQLEAAQEAWQNTVDLWQELEVMQVGPAGSSTEPGGEGLGDVIYAWPLTNPCAVDAHLVSEEYAIDADAVTTSANGLGAAEYLLFYAGDTNACGLEEDINISGSWDSLEQSTLTSRRLSYAAFAADTVSVAASALVKAWSPTGENFLSEFIQAGEGSRTYGKKRVAINAVSDALFYVEWNTKDNKLARPLGMIGCDDAFCPDLVESEYAHRSKEHLRNNMVGFRKLFKGCGVDNEGLGFDDYLYAVGQPELGEAIDEAALSTIAALDAIDEPDLVTALEQDIDSVFAVHTALGQLTDLLRSDFLTVLRLELPVLVQGDND
jgi:predicted lipoprotein